MIIKILHYRLPNVSHTVQASMSYMERLDLLDFI